MIQPLAQRRFCVREVAEAGSCAHVVTGLSFEDAALHFLEDHPSVDDAGEDVCLFVDDLETGERQCFRIDLETGETGPCD